MLKISNLSKSYATFPILDKINFTLHRGEHIGLIGPNGTGKTTLLHLINGLESPDKGSIWLDPHIRVGYLEQALVYASDATISNTIAGVIGQALAVLDQIEQVSQVLSTVQGDEYNLLLEQYGLLLEQAEQLDSYDASARLAQVLAGLGLDLIDEATPVRTLSGGQKTRLGLARLLLSQPDLLLLDEPTNHLDIVALKWLENFVRSYKGAVIIVSHDRAFLDRVIMKIVALNPLTHGLSEHDGNYSDYLAGIERQKEKQLDDYRRQQERIADIEANISVMKNRSANMEHQTIDFWLLKKAKRGARTAKVRERKLEKLLDSEKKIEKPRQTWQMKLDFGAAPSAGQWVLSLDKLSKSFGEHCLFENVQADIKQGERVALVGANGTGKTTLLRLIKGELAADSGNVRLGANVRIGYFSQEQESLKPNQSILEAVRAVAAIDETDTRNFLHFFLFGGDDVFKQVGTLSYGERARLALARLVLSKVNFLLLDEPLNHLDIAAREQFEEALEQFNGTILAVAHDRYFVENFADRIWVLHNQRLETFLGLADYEAILI